MFITIDLTIINGDASTATMHALWELALPECDEFGAITSEPIQLFALTI